MKKNPYIKIAGRKIGPDYEPFIIAEVGINHEGSLTKAKKMVTDAKTAGADCVKFQSHVVEDAMVPAAKKTIPGNAKVSIWEIMERCALTEKEEYELKKYTESLGLIYLCTPFSRTAADRLEKMKVSAYKIGSGECNNYPLIEHIASFGKPIILSTGMNDIPAVRKAVQIFKKYHTPFALLHTTSIYPTPYNLVRLGALTEIKKNFPEAVVGLSDHSFGIYTSLASIPLEASIIENHFTSNKKWAGPDISVSLDPKELKELVIGSKAIFQSLGGKKNILKEEKPTIDFAYACVVSIKPIIKGEKFTKDNIWVKRPGTGEIKAIDFKKVLGKKASTNIADGSQIKRSDVAKD